MGPQEGRKYSVSEGDIFVKMLEGDTIIQQDADILDLTATRLIDCEFQVSVLSKQEGQPLFYSNVTFQNTTTAQIAFDYTSLALSPRMHSHDYFEIALIDRGPVTFQVETVRKKYHPGDVLIINRAVRHTEDLLQNADMYSICISCGYLQRWLARDHDADRISKTLSRFITTNASDEFKPHKEMVEYLYAGDPSSIGTIGLIGEIRAEMEGKRPGYQLMVRALICRFFSLLSDTSQYQETYYDMMRGSDENLAQSVKWYLDNTKRKVARSEISAVMHYSDNHINRAFKGHYNMTVMAYNRQIYMKEAAKLLATTDMPISSIISALNLESKTHFYKNFAEIYSLSPTEYRAKMKALSKS